MRILMAITFMLFLASLITMLCLGQGSGSGGRRDYPNPKRLDKDIQSLEAEDKRHPPPQGAIVFVGSSSVRGWHKTIKDDLAPLTVIPRGFGGSNMNDAFHYADRIVLSYSPRAIVLYEGDNDIAQGISPRKIANTFQKFVDKIHQELPESRIYFLSIKPSISRWHLWPKMKEANGLIAKKCTNDKRLTFVDVASAMLDEKGTPQKAIFKKDKLHMTRDGYMIWRDVLKPILEKSELQFEEQKDEGAGDQIIKHPASRM